MNYREVIQVAGVIDQSEADLLVECGVRLLGFPLRLAVHHEDLSEKAAAQIIRRLPAECQGVLITYLSDADQIVSLCQYLGVTVVQLHGECPLDQLRRIKQLRPNLSIIKSLIVGARSLTGLRELMLSCDQYVDAYLTDTFDPDSGASGATGKTHDWDISRQLAEVSNRSLILAGGLTPDNVFAAIQAVRPAGVDAHTGLEGATGRKCRQKVERFIAEAQRGFRSLHRNAENGFV